MMKRTSNEPLERLQAAWDTLGSDEATRIVPRQRLWHGYATCYRRQMWRVLSFLMVAALLMVALVAAAVWRTRDWLDVVAVAITGSLLLYALWNAVARAVALRRCSPFSKGLDMPTELPDKRVPRLLIATVAVALLLVVATPAYGSTALAGDTAYTQRQMITKVDNILL